MRLSYQAAQQLGSGFKLFFSFDMRCVEAAPVGSPSPADGLVARTPARPLITPPPSGHSLSSLLTIQTSSRSMARRSCPHLLESHAPSATVATFQAAGGQSIPSTPTRQERSTSSRPSSSILQRSTLTLALWTARSTSVAPLTYGPAK